LRIGTAGASFDAGAWAAGAKQVSGAKYSNGIAHYEIPSADWTGKDVTVGVRAIGSNGKAAAWSNFVSVAVIAPPETPRNVKVTDTAEGEHLVWTAKGDSFRVFRRMGEATDFLPVATAQQPEWTDHDVDFDKLYAYRVQTVVNLAGGKEAEGEMSAEVGVTPQDVFPPAAPAGLAASAAPSSIELSWNPNTERTMGTYRVYRSTGGGAFENVADGVAIPAYSDRTAEHGKSYRYQVTAVSRTGHESPRSETVEITLP
jgi:fibronectin type 3 domain-containing protein